MLTTFSRIEKKNKNRQSMVKVKRLGIIGGFGLGVSISFFIK